MDQKVQAIITLFEREGIAMSLLTILKELWRFIKDYSLRILLGAIAVALLAVGGRYYLTNVFVEEDQEQAYHYLSEVYAQTPASLEMIVTMEDGSIYTNSHIFDEYFSNDQVIKQVEEATGIEFRQWREAEKALKLFKTGGFRGGLASIRDSSSNIFTIRFLVGKTDEENLAIAQAYSDILTSGDIPFLRNSTISIITEPISKDLLPAEIYESLANPQTLNPFKSPSAPMYIVYAVAGSIVGAIATIALTFFLRLSKKKITYGFDYAWSVDDYHLLYHTNHNNSSTLQEFIRVPVKENRVVLSQTSAEAILQPVLVEEDFKGLLIVNALQELVDVESNPEEIVILVHSNHTDKVWYREQAILAELYNVPVKIIHIV